MALTLRSKGNFRHGSITERAIRKERRAKRMRRGVVLFILSMLAIGGLVALYIWYNSQQAQHSTVAPPIDNTIPTISRPTPAANARVGVSIQQLTSTVAPGDNASVAIRTNPNATCTIEVEYDSVKAEDSGLSKKFADEFGVASWAWTVAPSAPEGTWPVTITCKNTKNSGVVQGSLKVAKSAPSSSN